MRRKRSQQRARRARSHGARRAGRAARREVLQRLGNADDDAGVADVFLGHENPRAADKTSAEELLTLEQERSSRPPAGDSDSDSDDDYEPDSDCDSD